MFIATQGQIDSIEIEVKDNKLAIRAWFPGGRLYSHDSFLPRRDHNYGYLFSTGLVPGMEVKAKVPISLPEEEENILFKRFLHKLLASKASPAQYDQTIEDCQKQVWQEFLQECHDAQKESNES